MMVALSSSEKPPMGRPRKHNKHLPPCVYHRHGAFWLVKRGVWESLGTDLPSALAEYARRIQPATESAMVMLIREAMETIRTRGLAKNTVDQYEVAARKLEFAFRDFEPQQIRGRNIMALRKGMQSTPGMFNQCLSLLRQVFNYAMGEQRIDDNPAIGIPRYPQNERKRLITRGEFDAIYAVAGPRLKCMLDLWRITGQRVMDVVNIRLQDVLDEGVGFKQQKTGTLLTVRWTPELRAVVARAKLLNGNARSTTLFATKRGRTRGAAPSHTTVNEEWSAACEAAGIEDAQARDLRAVAGTEAKRQGKNPQELLGHETGRTTKIYLRDREALLVDPPSFGQVLDNGQKE